VDVEERALRRAERLDLLGPDPAGEAVGRVGLDRDDLRPARVGAGRGRDAQRARAGVAALGEPVARPP
jgi:hypothetical protein